GEPALRESVTGASRRLFAFVRRGGVPLFARMEITPEEETSEAHGCIFGSLSPSPSCLFVQRNAKAARRASSCVRCTRIVAVDVLALPANTFSVTEPPEFFFETCRLPSARTKRSPCTPNN
ncbi:unnamed protein product, partial [Scytosiphon promiscuus]